MLPALHLRSYIKNNYTRDRAMTEHAINRKRLYHVGNLSIFMIGLGFAVRANIAPNLQEEIYDKIDLANSASMVGEALGLHSPASR